jgi:putative heme-binding domain-containing protein
VGWATVQAKLTSAANGDIRLKALMLGVLFSSKNAAELLRKSVTDAKVDLETRRGALQALIDARAADLLPLLRELLGDVPMRGPALRGLAAFNDATVPETILRHYATFSDADKADAISTLASRASYALALLNAMEKGTVPRRDLSAFTARQLIGLKDKRVSERLTAVWGSIRPSTVDKTALMTKYRSIVPPDALTKADRSHGRALFAKTCAACHTLFNEGGKIGPDLTGSQRTNPEYLLTKLLDPNAVVAKDFQVSLITTVSGRSITGIVTKEDDKTLTVQTPTEALTLTKKDVEDRQKTGQSLMPENLLTPLSDTELRDLFAYLVGAGQVPLP